MQKLPPFLQKLHSEHGDPDRIANDPDSIRSRKTAKDSDRAASPEGERQEEVGEDAPQVVVLEKRKGKIKEKHEAIKDADEVNINIPTPKPKSEGVELGGRRAAPKKKVIGASAKVESNTKRRKIGLSYDDE